MDKRGLVELGSRRTIVAIVSELASLVVQAVRPLGLCEGCHENTEGAVLDGRAPANPLLRERRS